MPNTPKKLTQPPDWWEAFQAEADKQGVTLSEWMAAAAIKQLPQSVAKRLSERPPAHRPKRE